MKTNTLIIFYLAIYLIAFSSFADAATWTIDRLDDSTNVTPCTSAPNDCTFRGAFFAASNGDTINVSSAIFGQTIVLTGTVSVLDHNLRIEGPGPGLITVQSPRMVLDFFSAQTGVRLSGFTFANSGGGIDVGVGSMIMSNMILKDNAGPNDVGNPHAGIIVDPGGSVTISGSQFINNRTQTLTSLRDGGAIRNRGTVTIDNSDFIGNIASSSGGAIYNSTGGSGPSSLTITNSRFSGNSAHSGGAVYNYAGVMTISDTIFSNNVANAGGAVVNSYLGTIVNSTFIENSAVAAGAIYGNQRGGTNSELLGDLTVLNCTFSGNRASMEGGAIYSAGISFLRHLTVTNNSAATAGGLFLGTNYNLANSIITDNTAPSIPNTSATGSNNLIGIDARLRPLGSYGGVTQTRVPYCNSPAIGAGSNALSVDKSGNPLGSDQRGIVRNHGIAVDIGAVEAAEVFVSNISDNVLDSGSLRKAIADAPSGGMVCFDPVFFSTPRTIAMNGDGLLVDKTLIIEGPGTSLLTLDANFTSRHFSFMPPGFFSYLSGMTLTRGKPALSDPEWAWGGSIFVGGSLSDSGGVRMNISNIVISNSEAGAGGGIYNRGVLELSDTTVTGCRGSGVYNDPNKFANITRTIVHNNTAVQGAGIVNLGIMTIADSSIRFNIANHANGGSGSSPLGGGVFNYSPGRLRMDRSLVANNTAQLGGGLYNTGYADLRNSTFTSNGAVQTGNGPTADGGAIYADGNYVGTLMATIDTVNCTISGNAAVNSGGGVFMKQISGSFAMHNMVNTINALNSAPAGRNISGEVISYGYNLISDNSGLSWSGNSPTLAGNIVGTTGSPVNPRFAPFGDYGGPTPMLVLLPNSPAIDAGHPTFIPATDQRGVARPIGARADIGAYERTITFDQATIPNEAIGAAYNGGNGVQLSANRQNSVAMKGVLPESFAPTQFSIMPLSGQQLPPGITLSPTGLLSGTPTMLGAYTFTVKATDTDGMGGVQQYTMMVLAPTAASVSVSGRVLTAEGMPLKNATVVITNTNGDSRTALTSSFGYYRFDDVEVGHSYVVSVSSKRYQFEPRIISVQEEILELDLTAGLASGKR